MVTSTTHTRSFMPDEKKIGTLFLAIECKECLSYSLEGTTLPILEIEVVLYLLFVNTQETFHASSGQFGMRKICSWKATFCTLHQKKAQKSRN